MDLIFGCNLRNRFVFLIVSYRGLVHCLNFWIHYKQDWIKLFGQYFAIVNTPPHGTTIDYTKPPAHPSPPLPFDAYVGTSFNDFVGEIGVAVKNGGLVLELGPNKTAYPMGQYDSNIFYYQPTGENAYGLSGVTFTIGGGEKATSVLVENLNVASPGMFIRK